MDDGRRNEAGIEDRWKGEMEAFGRFLEYQGKSPKTIRSYTAYVRRCLTILGDGFSPERSDPGWEDILREAFSDVDPRSAGNYIGGWRLFVRSLSAVEPDSCGDVPYHLSEEFSEDLDAYAKRLRAGGMSNLMVEKNVRYVRHCWRLMAEHIGDVRPEDVDVGVLDEVGGFMDDITDGARSNNLRALGRFVYTVTGDTDPYLAMTAPVYVEELMPYIDRLVDGDRYGNEIHDYAVDMRRRGNRDASIRTAVNHIRGCLKRLEGSDWDVSLEYIGRDAFVYLYQETMDLKESTSRTYLSDFGKFLEFVTGTNPLKNTQLVWNHPATVAERRFITDSEYHALIEAATPEEELIVRLGGEMGLRRSEIARIRLEDIGDRTIVIRGKGRGPRGYVTNTEIPDSVKHAIGRYLPFREEILKVHGDRSRGNLMVRSRQRAGEPLPPDQVGEIVERLSRRTGIEVTPHCFRRYFATRLYMEGVSPLDIQRRMRHAVFETTARCYLDSDPNDFIACKGVLKSAIQTW